MNSIAIIDSGIDIDFKEFRNKNKISYPSYMDGVKEYNNA